MGYLPSGKQQIPVVINPKEVDQSVSPEGVYVAEVITDNDTGLPIESGNLKLMALKDIKGVQTMPAQEWQNTMLGPKLSNIADSSAL